MQNKQILSTQPLELETAPARPRPRAPVQRALVFDACHVGVVLRAVLFVQAAVAVGYLFVFQDVWSWLIQVAATSAVTQPAVMAWLLVGCALKHWLGRWPLWVQAGVGVSLGVLAGALATGLMAWLDLASSALCLAGSLSGALLAGVLVAGLVWRAKAQAPASTRARLAELQSRIRPHFLFNTLNTAIALVREEPAKAEAVLEDLSDLFRHALTEQGDSSSVGQEIELARRYLAIEQVRFGERLQVEWALDERAHAARLPPLILQPLVENAVKHGVEPSARGAQLRVSTQVRGQMALIKVTNTVPAGQGHAGHGLALANVRDRLRLLHDLEADFRTALVDDVYQARIEVPLPGRGA